MLVDAVRAGELTEARLDSSVRRVVRDKFAQGLFENPYADPAVAARLVGAEEFRAAALDAQRRSLVLLENARRMLPLAPAGKRVFLHRVSPDVARRYGWTVVDDPAVADVAIMRIDAPFQLLHPGYVFGAMQHEGDLGFRDGDPEWETVKRVSARVPTVVTVYLDRPAILTALKPRVRALVANFGVSDEALLDVLTGRARPEGRLPFELPSSMRAVEAQRSDVPHDSERPLYPIGFGRQY
jgi:beta-glucosidase